MKSKEWNEKCQQSALQQSAAEAEEDFLDSLNNRTPWGVVSDWTDNTANLNGLVFRWLVKKRCRTDLLFAQTSKDKPKSVTHTWTNLFYFTLSTQ